MREHFFKNSKLLPLCLIFILMWSVKCHGLSRDKYVYTAPQQTGDGWETDSLGNMNIDVIKIIELMHNILDGSYKNIHSVLLVKSGKLVLEEYFDGFNGEKLHEIRSATKSIGSILVGIAIDHRFIKGIDERVYTYFKDYELEEKWDKRAKYVTLKALLTMTSGYDCDDHATPPFECERKMHKTNDWVKYALNLPMAFQPGKHWAYNSSSLILVSEIISKTSKISVSEFANRYLFEPLGISGFQWGLSPKGRVWLAGNAKMRPRDMAKFGYMVLNGGTWKGNQIVSKAWIEESTTSHTKSKNNRDYGYLWWRGKHLINNQLIEGYWAEGNGGQCIFICPKVDLVAVFNGGNYNSPLELQPLGMLIDYILPSILPPAVPRRYAKLDSKTLNALVGECKFKDYHLTIFRERDKLYGRIFGQTTEAFPLTETRFIASWKFVGNTQIDVFRDKKGVVKYLTVHSAFNTMQFDKFK